MKSKISCKQNFYNINTRLALSLSLSIVFCVLPLKNTCTCSFDESGKISPNSVSLSHTHTPIIEMGARSLIDYLCHSISILQSPYLVFSLSHTYQLLSLSLASLSCVLVLTISNTDINMHSHTRIHMVPLTHNLSLSNDQIFVI